MSQALRQIVILARNKKSYDVVKRQKSNVIQLNGGADCRIHFSVIVPTRRLKDFFSLRARGKTGRGRRCSCRHLPEGDLRSKFNSLERIHRILSDCQRASRFGRS